MRAWRVWLGSVAREESRGEKTPVAPLTLCRRWLPQNAQQCRRARHSANRARRQELFFAGSDARGWRAAIITTLIETAKFDDVEGVLSSSPLREAFENDHGRRIALQHFARQVRCARKPCVRPPRAQANLRRGRVARRSFTAAWRGRHEFRSGLSGVRQAIGAPATPAGARQPARSSCCSSRPLPRSRPFARWDVNSPRW